jgi:hypothetical protein
VRGWWWRRSSKNRLECGVYGSGFRVGSPKPTKILNSVDSACLPLTCHPSIHPSATPSFIHLPPRLPVQLTFETKGEGDAASSDAEWAASGHVGAWILEVWTAEASVLHLLDAHIHAHLPQWRQRRILADQLPRHLQRLSMRCREKCQRLHCFTVHGLFALQCWELSEWRPAHPCFLMTRLKNTRKRHHKNKTFIV